jgi:hypothetical protein
MLVLFTLSVFTTTADPGTVWLDELDVRLSSCGWSHTKAKRSVGNKPLNMGGITYERGVGTHPPGEFHVRLDGGTKRFTSLVGIDAESGDKGTAEFVVVGDNKTLWKSGVMKGGQAPKKADVNLDGVKLLKLIVTVGGDNYGHDHTDWADAKFEVTGKKPVAVKAPNASGGEIEFPDVSGPDAIAVATPGTLQKDYEAEFDRISRLNPAGYRFPPGQVFNTNALALASDKGPVGAGVRRLEALVGRLKTLRGVQGLNAIEKQLATLKERKTASREEERALYVEIRRLTRRAVLANPLLDFDAILFIARGVLNDHKRGKSEYDGDHFCDQYYGHNGREGGGLMILDNWTSEGAEVFDVVEGLKVPPGTNEGMPLSEGTFLAPDLSWDAKTIAFAWSSGNPKKWAPESRFHVFTVGVDGTGLTRVTDGEYDDIDPCWLPNGRLVFLSTRRCGYGRCHGRPVPVYTMYSCKPDGSDLYSIDYHETNEFHPSVDNNGMLVYTRWDYVDRDHSAAHHMWHCFPDGRNPRAFHGNYPLPLTTVEGDRFPHGIRMRPWAEFNCRGVPGSGKYIATAGPHHGQAFGSLVMIDISVPDDGKMSQARRITPDYLFPESECGMRNWDQMAYGTAWPLSEQLYLCNYRDTICVLDDLGTREPVCRVLNGLRPLDPTPLRARTRPPVIPPATFQGERAGPDAPEATISVMNAYITDEFGTLPEGTDIRQLRVVQILPKSTPRANNPRIGFGDQSLARIPLGVVPVEKDGSLYFKAPVGKAIYFQLLDKNGMAVHSMRSVTYVHPGEQLSCIGCHEDKQQPPEQPSQPIATRRAPSKLEPEIDNPVMFSFHTHVRPIFEKKCVGCHEATENAGPRNMSYKALQRHMFYLGHGIGKKLHGGSRIKAGKFGAMFSSMGKALLNENHRKLLAEGKFTQQDVRAIVMWLDMNSNEYSVYKNVDAQKRGELVWPEFDVVEREDGTELFSERDVNDRVE